MVESEALQQHSQSYLHHSKACAVQLHHVWEDLEVPRDDQTRELREITNNAQKVWSEAIQLAEDKRAGLHDRISNSLNEIDRIREQLGEQHGFNHPVSSSTPLLDKACLQHHFATYSSYLIQDDGSQCSPSASLMSRYQAMQSQAEHWQQRKAHRLQEFTSLQVQLLCLQ